MNRIDRIAKPGIRVDIIPDDQPKEAVPGEVKVYQTKVSDMLENGDVEVYMPMEQESVILLLAEGRMDLCFYAASGVYEVRAVVRERRKRAGLYYAVLHLTGEVKKRQRREFYRYVCTLPAFVRTLTPEERVHLKSKGRFVVMSETLPFDECTVLDISGGGIQLHSRNLYGEDDLIYIKFDFGQKYEQCLKILGCTPVPEQNGEYRYRSKFVGMTGKIREEIIQHIFLLERMRQRAGKKEL